MWTVRGEFWFTTTKMLFVCRLTWRWRLEVGCGFSSRHNKVECLAFVFVCLSVVFVVFAVSVFFVFISTVSGFVVLAVLQLPPPPPPPHNFLKSQVVGSPRPPAKRLSFFLRTFCIFRITKTGALLLLFTFAVCWWPRKPTGICFLGFPWWSGWGRGDGGRMAAMWWRRNNRWKGPRQTGFFVFFFSRSAEEMRKHEISGNKFKFSSPSISIFFGGGGCSKKVT